MTYDPIGGKLNSPEPPKPTADGVALQSAVFSVPPLTGSNIVIQVLPIPIDADREDLNKITTRLEGRLSERLFADGIKLKADAMGREAVFLIIKDFFNELPLFKVHTDGYDIEIEKLKTFKELI